MARRSSVLLCATLLLGLIVVLVAADRPATRTATVIEKLHGVPVLDPYRWLEDGTSEEVRQWVEKQNAHTREHLDRLPDRTRIGERLGELLEVGIVTTPVPVSGGTARVASRLFYSRRDGKQNQPVLCMRDGPDGEDQVIVDPNTLAEDGTASLEWWYPSRDGNLVAYGLSRSGIEQPTLHVRDVAGGKQLADVIPRTRGCSLAWTPDSKGFFYTRYPGAGSVPKGEENYRRRVYFHKLGDDPEKDALVFGDGRSAEDWPEVRLSPDGRWLVVVVRQGWVRTEVYFKDQSKPDATFVPLVEKVPAIFNVVARNDRLYVHTNDSAPRYRLYAVDPLQPEREHWSEVLSEGKDVLETVHLFGDTILATFTVKASSQIELFEKTGKPLGEVSLPALGTVAGVGGEWDGDEAYIGFQSFAMPPSVYRIDLKTQKAELWQRVKSNIDPAKYTVEQVTYLSRDKTPVTMFLTHKKGLERDGKTPALLIGYGGFGINQTPTFSASRMLFLEKGGILAVANLRGGGEYGEDWHRSGMLGKKQNAFDDFIAAAQWLLSNNCTDRDHLAIQGGSNGGLLVGAAITQKPDLFRAACCHVPLLDMVRYHKFLLARMWVSEYGSADDPEQFKWLHAYSPYHRVKDGTAYPAVLLTAAESDSRVDPLHARKMAARLQAATSSSHPILLRQEMRAGHGSGKPRSKQLEEQMDVWSFLFAHLGMKM